jgi:hypothetical protein
MKRIGFVVAVISMIPDCTASGVAVLQKYCNELISRGEQLESEGDRVPPGIIKDLDNVQLDLAAIAQEPANPDDKELNDRLSKIKSNIEQLQEGLMDLTYYLSRPITYPPHSPY